jgi:Holliday junction resolvase RusA-like endonuclease
VKAFAFFFVTGTPVAQPRVRMIRSNGHVYTPRTADAWKTAIRLAWRAEPRQPMEGPVRLSLNFCMPRPQYHYTSKGALTTGAPTWHTIKPDTDNLVKAVMDALTDAGAWHDDCQIVELSSDKRYGGGRYGCAINMMEL